MSQLVKDAFKESCVRYPMSVNALVFFASASGLFEYGTLTMEDINAAREAIRLPPTSAAVVTEVP